MSLVGANGQPINNPTPAPQPDEPKPPMQVVTAFTVFLLPDGRWAASDDLSTVFVPMRKPSLDDLLSGAANVQAEITARKAADMAAATTIQTQLAMARQAQQQMVRPDEAAALQNLQRR